MAANGRDIRKKNQQNELNGMNHTLLESIEKIKENLIFGQQVPGVGSWLYDTDNDQYYGSEEMYRMYEIDPKSHVSNFKNTIDLIHPEDRKKVQEAVEMHLTGKACALEYRIPLSDGTIRYVEAKGEPIFGKDGKMDGIFGSIVDITEKKTMETTIENHKEKIHLLNRRFQVLIQDSNDVFEITSPAGVIEYISPAIYKVLGFTPEERIGKNTFELFNGENREKVINLMKQALEKPGATLKTDVESVTKDGKQIFLELNVCNQLEEPAIQGMVLNWRDISPRIRSQMDSLYVAMHDELTGLPNRAFLRKELNELCKKEDKFGVFVLDVHGFKYINETLGYERGDLLLIIIAKRLKEYFDEEVIISRNTGDQFIIIMKDSQLESYRNMARDIMQMFSEPVRLQRFEVVVSLNAGISIYPQDGKDVATLIKNAEIALKRAKQEGKGNYKFYSSDVDIKSYKQFTLRNDLFMAIQRNQFRVYYQPQINMNDNSILAAEALIRWEHPDWGMVSPYEFISLAEESGFITTLGDWMLHEVCKNYKKWQEEGVPTIKISVNYSAVQFAEKNFVDKIVNTIKQFDLEPDFLIIEITESIFLKNQDKAIHDIRKLQELGMQVALDDFGTGYSSLAYLNTFHIDVLKIDRSFIKEVPNDDTNTIITRAVINMARELRIKLVIEGVETWEQLTFLKNANCYTAQGYLYSKPVDRMAFERLLAVGKCLPTPLENDINNIKDRRQYPRFYFNEPIKGYLTVLDLNGRRINVGNTKVWIKNIGLGGLCFIGKLRLPVQKEVILQITTQLMGEKLLLFGQPVWREEQEDEIFAYGVKFNLEDPARESLEKAIETYSTEIK